jgi:hypothetical protein
MHPQTTKHTPHHFHHLQGQTTHIAQPVVRLDTNPDANTNKLNISSEGKTIELLNNPIDIICNSPCLVRTDERILFISKIDGQKLKPFFTKECILIPRNSEIKYFGGFVLNAVNNFKVEGTGFEIVEPESEKIAHLSIETSLKGSPVMILSYKYSGISITPDEPSLSVTKFSSGHDKFVFRKFVRNLQWEKKCRDTLEELGFYSDDNIHFAPQYEGKNSYEELYTMLEAVNRNYSEIIESGFHLDSGRLERNYNLKPVNIEISNRLVDDWFDLRAVISIGEWQIPFIRLKSNI